MAEQGLVTPRVTQNTEKSGEKTKREVKSKWCGRRGSNPHGQARGILRHYACFEIQRAGYPENAKSRVLLLWNPLPVDTVDSGEKCQ